MILLALALGRPRNDNDNSNSDQTTETRFTGPRPSESGAQQSRANENGPRVSGGKACARARPRARRLDTHWATTTQPDPIALLAFSFLYRAAAVR
jgi:hypothetical protein